MFGGACIRVAQGSAGRWACAVGACVCSARLGRTREKRRPQTPEATQHVLRLSVSGEHHFVRDGDPRPWMAAIQSKKGLKLDPWPKYVSICSRRNSNPGRFLAHEGVKSSVEGNHARSEHRGTNSSVLPLHYDCLFLFRLLSPSSSTSKMLKKSYLSHSGCYASLDC
jgi:hypothetical protein